MPLASSFSCAPATSGTRSAIDRAAAARTRGRALRRDERERDVARLELDPVVQSSSGSSRAPRHRRRTPPPSRRRSWARRCSRPARPRASGLRSVAVRRVAVMEGEQVSVRVGEERHVTDARVVRLGNSNSTPALCSRSIVVATSATRSAMRYSGRYSPPPFCSGVLSTSPTLSASNSGHPSLASGFCPRPSVLAELELRERSLADVLEPECVPVPGLEALDVSDRDE